MAGPLLNSDMMTRLERLQVVSRRMVTGRMRGERRSRRHGYSTDFADYRNYVPGDDVRYLDWRIYARLEKLYLKLFQEEEDLQVFLLLDISPSMDFGEPNKLLYAKQVAAALGYLCLCSMDSLTCHCFNERLVSQWGPHRGKPNGPAFLDFLQNTPPAGTTSLQEVLRRFSMTVKRKGFVVVLSDFYDFAGYEEGLRSLFGRNFEVLVLHILSPEELKPQLKGDWQLVDAEFGLTTDVSVGPALLKQYGETLNVFSEDLRRFVTQRGGMYLLCSSALLFDKLVLDILCRKGVVQ